MSPLGLKLRSNSSSAFSTCCFEMILMGSIVSIVSILAAQNYQPERCQGLMIIKMKYDLYHIFY